MKPSPHSRLGETVVFVCFLLLRGFGLLMVYGFLLARGWEAGAYLLPMAVGALWLTKLVIEFKREPWPDDHLVLDEGGLRWRSRGRRGYLVLPDVVSAKATRWRRVPTVTIATANETFDVATGGTSADFFETELARQRWRRRYVRPPAHPDLARGRRALGAWLAAARRARGIGESAAYRMRQRADDALVALACDRKADAEPRAAAAHLVLASRDEDAIARVLDVFGTQTPPIVVIAAALAAPERIREALLDDALVALSLEEANEACALLAASPPEAPHVRVAAPEVAEEFSEDEAEPAAARMRR